MTERDRLLTYLGSIARPGADLQTIGDNDNLIDAGIVDSFAFVQIIQYLETELGVSVQQYLVSPEDLTSIEGILDTIQLARQ